MTDRIEIYFLYFLKYAKIPNPTITNKDATKITTVGSKSEPFVLVSGT
jgi:hypothetical protein